MSGMKVLFVTPTLRAFGETTTALALADRLTEQGGDAWFLASPDAAKVVQKGLRERVHVMTPHLGENRSMWRRIVTKVRPHAVVLSELIAIWYPQFVFPHRVRGYPLKNPLINWQWFREVQGLDATLAVIDTPDFHFRMAPWTMEKLYSRYPSQPLVWRPVRSVLERMWVLLPCPLHEPGPVKGRRGIPYRSLNLPLKLDPQDRAKMRSRFLGQDHQEEAILIVMGVSGWSRQLAERHGYLLFEYLGELLGAYLADLAKRVTLVCAANQPLLRASKRHNLKVVNVDQMPPDDYEKLLLSSDLVITLDETAYSLGKVLGNVPSLVLVNSYALEEALDGLPNDGPIRRLVLDIERRRRGSIYPHIHYPLRAGPGLMADGPANRRHPRYPSTTAFQRTVRRGHFVSSPYLRAELYGGDETRDLFHWVLCDPAARGRLREQEDAYIERQSSLDDGVAALKRVLTGGPAGHTMLDPW